MNDTMTIADAIDKATRFIKRYDAATERVLAARKNGWADLAEALEELEAVYERR